jgi:hypothetical protein
MAKLGTEYEPALIPERNQIETRAGCRLLRRYWDILCPRLLFLPSYSRLNKSRELLHNVLKYAIWTTLDL